MKITPEEAHRRLSAQSNLANLASSIGAVPVTQELSPSNVTHVVKERPKRNTPNIPEVTRDVMATLVAEGQSGQQIADAFGVSRMSVSNAARGRSGPNPPNEERRRKIESRQLEVRDTALEKLMMSLGLITQDNLAELGPKDLSLVAKNMGAIAHSITAAEEQRSPVNIVVYTPEMKKVDQFKVIDV